MIGGGYWSAYWYRGKIYGTEIVRGLDVLSLVPSEFLSGSEIAAAVLADQGSVFNPQQQLRYDWPAEPVVARAYLDQLERANALAASLAADLDSALDQSAATLADSARDEALATRIESLAASVETDAGNSMTTSRQAALVETLAGIAARLR